MKALKRRQAIILLSASALTFLSGSLFSADKKKNNKKNDNKKKNNNKKNNKPDNKKKEDNNKPQNLSGKIILVEEDISRIYKLAGPKKYSFSKTLEDKISPFLDQEVTLSGVVDGDRIITIESIKAAKSS